MKKIIALILACLMLTMSFVACTTGNGETTTEPVVENNGDVTTAPEADQTTEEVTEAPVELPYASAEELLKLLMDTYNATASEETKLYVGGGNVNNFDTVNPEGPAKFVAVDNEDYNQNLGYPAADVSKLDDAASMFNLMNTNVFNCYAVHFTNSADVDAMATTIKENILARQWICGAPEKLVIVKMPGDYLVVVWGAVQFGGIVDPVVASFTATVEGSAIVVEHNFEA